MGIFLRTVIITLVLCLVYYFYVSLNEASYRKELKPPQSAEEQILGKENSKEKENKTEEAEKKEVTIKICLINASGDYKFVNRTAKDEGIQTAVSLLLKGVTEEEKKQGLFSEIPPNTKLYWVKEEKGDLIINLSENFAQGGGTTSVMSRINQLVKTVKIYNPNAPVYLYLNGKKAEYIGGDGVFLKQPLN